MTVYFNALQTSLSGGIGRYSYELSKTIYKLNKIDFKIVIREEDKELFKFAKAEDLYIVHGIKNSKDRNYYEQFVLPRKIYKIDRNAIIHYPDSMAPLFAKNKIVLTLHDMAFLARPNDFTLKTRLWKKYVTKVSVRKARKIICITEFTKKEFGKYFPKYTHKSVRIYNGFNDFSKENINYEIISDYIKNIVNRKYLLTVSTISPRKNIDGLIKAFNLIKDKVPYDLIIAGKKGWLYEDVFKLVDDLDLNDRIIFTGQINDDELKYLYKNASLFVYPSFYEGFGLPPLEAMSYGIPCIVSNAASIPEVVGDAALLTDPYSKEDLSTNILKLIKNRNIRCALIKKGYESVKMFSWEKCAEDTIRVYTNLKG
ncbi:MAG: glycosyltransferase family 1 protein [Clostridiales bacterium]|nr:glycosyltransferase family 1 protein [Clostridiales bacterium]